MQDSDFKWFLENYELLFEKYGSSFLAIKDKNVLGVFKTYAEGVKQIMKKEKIGTFIVQQCLADKIAATNAFVASIDF